VQTLHLKTKRHVSCGLQVWCHDLAQAFRRRVYQRSCEAKNYRDDEVEISHTNKFATEVDSALKIWTGRRRGELAQQDKSLDRSDKEGF
jgi:hypothetical protein